MNQIDYKTAYQNVMIANKMLYEENQKLQSNWNSLKEWVKENSWYYNTSDGCQWVDQFKLLDKMNELEREEV